MKEFYLEKNFLTSKHTTIKNILLKALDKILAKHDENYMPPEVSKALEKANN